MAMVKDPVCGKEVDTVTAYRSPYLGEMYYFCSHDCRKRFEEHPAQYLPDREIGTPGKRE